MPILAPKRAYNRFFGAKKSVIEGKAYGKALQLHKKTEFYNALFDAEKCDIGPENACNWKQFVEFPVGYLGPS